TAAIGGRYFKSVVFSGDTVHALILADIELVMIGHTAIVFEGFVAVGLFIQTGHGDIPDFQQFRRGEKDHVGGIVVDRVDHAAFFDQDGADAAALELDSASQAGGAGAHHQSIHQFGVDGRRAHSLASTSPAIRVS